MDIETIYDKLNKIYKERISYNTDTSLFRGCITAQDYDDKSYMSDIASCIAKTNSFNAYCQSRTEINYNYRHNIPPKVAMNE